MNFCIQLGNPKTEVIKKRDYDDLSDAIVAIYPEYTEFMHIIWQGISIAVEYKYDVSVMIIDILEIKCVIHGNIPVIILIGIHARIIDPDLRIFKDIFLNTNDRIKGISVLFVIESA